MAQDRTCPPNYCELLKLHDFSQIHKFEYVELKVNYTPDGEIVKQQYSHDSISRSYSINCAVLKSFKKSLFNVQYDLKIFCLLHEKLNGLNFSKNILLNMKYDVNNQGLNFLVLNDGKYLIIEL